jgi:sporulation protein YtfJ
MSDHPIQGIMSTALDKIKSMVEVDTIIGNPMKVAENITLIPVSKVSFGFASGGSDIPSKVEKDVFGGGSGAGVTVTPVCFIVVQNEDVRIMNINTSDGYVDKAIAMVPEVFDKVSSIFKKDKPTAQK